MKALGGSEFGLLELRMLVQQENGVVKKGELLEVEGYL
jgi:hypothetical protein